MSADEISYRLLGVDDVRACARIMKTLISRGHPVAVDAEGERLSAKGRLTLLQIASWEGEIYIIDVVDPLKKTSTAKGNDLLVEGGVKELLETPAVLKVFHSCSGDSAALYHQFGITVNNVFDTQCAHMAIEITQKNRYFPRKLRLDAIGEEYDSAVHDSKDYVEVWRNDPDFWGRRPLPEEALTYAAQDVAVLVPHLYSAMNSRVQSARNTKELLRDLVDEEVHGSILSHRTRITDQRETRDSAAMVTLFRQIDQNRNYNMRTELDDLTEDETKAVEHLKEGQHELYTTISSLVKKLEEKKCERDLLEIRELMEEALPSITPGREKRFKRMTSHPEPRVQTSARQLWADFHRKRGNSNRGRGRGGHRGRGRGNQHQRRN